MSLTYPADRLSAPCPSMLVTLPSGSLIVKRFQETPPRPWLIWTMDVSKQGLGALHAHFLNMLIVSDGRQRDFTPFMCRILLSLRGRRIS